MNKKLIDLIDFAINSKMEFLNLTLDELKEIKDVINPSKEQEEYKEFCKKYKLKSSSKINYYMFKDVNKLIEIINNIDLFYNNYLYDRIDELKSLSDNCKDYEESQEYDEELNVVAELEDTIIYYNKELKELLGKWISSFNRMI